MLCHHAACTNFHYTLLLDIVVDIEVLSVSSTLYLLLDAQTLRSTAGLVRIPT
jgi:hypothetical protein